MMSTILFFISHGEGGVTSYLSSTILDITYRIYGYQIYNSHTTTTQIQVLCNEVS